MNYTANIASALLSTGVKGVLLFWAKIEMDASIFGVFVWLIALQTVPSMLATSGYQITFISHLKECITEESKVRALISRLITSGCFQLIFLITYFMISYNHINEEIDYYLYILVVLSGLCLTFKNISDLFLIYSKEPGIIFIGHLISTIIVAAFMALANNTLLNFYFAFFLMSLAPITYYIYQKRDIFDWSLARFSPSSTFFNHSHYRYHFWVGVLTGMVIPLYSVVFLDIFGLETFGEIEFINFLRNGFGVIIATSSTVFMAQVAQEKASTIRAHLVRLLTYILTSAVICYFLTSLIPLDIFAGKYYEILNHKKLIIILIAATATSIFLAKSAALTGYMRKTATLNILHVINTALLAIVLARLDIFTPLTLYFYPIIGAYIINTAILSRWMIKNE